MIDTLKLRNALLRAGVKPEKEEDMTELVEALAARDVNLVTKEHLDLTLKAELAPMKRDLVIIQAGIIAVFMLMLKQAFFP
jgi:hypothetical protein